ncbi:hypothetical protein [Streptomyces sp. NPDC051909]|uniref:hypothetical protein n=1 Tax=Streptomyces sp. NPDC051909 TaxID=3154944 RepID=UPI0034348670
MTSTITLSASRFICTHPLEWAENRRRQNRPLDSRPIHQLEEHLIVLLTLISVTFRHYHLLGFGRFPGDDRCDPSSDNSGGSQRGSKNFPAQAGLLTGNDA